MARGLRFRLTASFLVFFTVMLALIGVGFRNTLARIQQAQLREMIDADWAALRGYLQVSQDGVRWRWNSDNAQEEFIVEGLRRVFLLTDQEGKIIDISPAYRVLGPETPAEIRAALRSQKPIWKTRYTSSGSAYLLRSGAFSEGTEHRYYVSLGRSLSMNDAVVERFTLRYFATLPVIVFIGGLLGWLLTKGAMRPLQDVVRTSESITGANLNLRIPLRGANDELDRLIDTFNRMVERLENSFQQMRQFTTDVSHELRTPITAVRGQLEVALMTARSEEELRDAIQAALEEAERLSNLVKAMLALSHAESGQTVLRRERLDLAVLAGDIAEQYRILADEAGINLVTGLPAGCEAAVDRTQFERLVSNLLTNALKHTPAGGEVRLTLKPLASAVELTIEDTGCGIPPQHLPHIFDRFYRVPGANSQRGLGLGLSFVAWIVRAHVGRIEASSEPGRGSKFVVRLPRLAIQSTLFT
jgi:heavy metal sensor kinase